MVARVAQLIGNQRVVNTLKQQSHTICCARFRTSSPELQNSCSGSALALVGGNATSKRVSLKLLVLKVGVGVFAMLKVLL
jgi:hypothetical protein